MPGHDDQAQLIFRDGLRNKGRVAPLRLTNGQFHKRRKTDPDNSAKAEKNTVRKTRDGTKLFGFVEITDDRTIRITADSGNHQASDRLRKLSDADFQKY